MKFGVHVGIGGGLDRAPHRAAEKGCDCFQLFVSNPRSWAPPRADDSEVDAFRHAREAKGLCPVVVHITYLPNCASPDPALWKKSAAHQRAQYALAAAMGAEYFVIHPGSHRGDGLDGGIERLALAIRQTLDATPDGPVFLLENTAGGGDTIGRAPEELAAIAEQVDAPGRVSLCLDTCHAFACGVDVGKKGAFARFITAHERTVGAGSVRLVHANDSRFALAAGRDRHQHIGLGEIGEEGFRNILRSRKVRSLPFILETPEDDSRTDADNLDAIRKLAP